MSFLHYKVDANEKNTIRVNIRGQANVRLMDQLNYYKFKRGGAYKAAASGFTDSNPINLNPPYKGEWHVIIDTGGTAGDVRASVDVLQS